MMYNKAELTAMQVIASKLNWHKPVDETVETITKMVRNQQSLELDCVGECLGFEETLLSLALWDRDKILSTQFVSDYQSLSIWNGKCLCEDMGITPEDFWAMMEYYEIVLPKILEEEADEDYYYMLDLCDYYASREY